MTDIQDTATAPLHDPDWRLLRDPDRPVHHTEAGRIAVPLLLSDRDNSLSHAVALVLTADGAIALRGELDALLTAGAASGPGVPTAPGRRAELYESLVGDGLPA